MLEICESLFAMIVFESWRFAVSVGSCSRADTVARLPESLTTNPDVVAVMSAGWSDARFSQRVARSGKGSVLSTSAALQWPSIAPGWPVEAPRSPGTPALPVGSEYRPGLHLRGQIGIYHNLLCEHRIGLKRLLIGDRSGMIQVLPNKKACNKQA